MIRRVYELTIRIEVQGDDNLTIEDGMFDLEFDFKSNTNGFDVIDTEIVNGVRIE